jgi:glycerate-2-kinase
MSIFKNYNELVGPDIKYRERAIVLDILEAGIESVQPHMAMKDFFENGEFELPEKVTILGWGKASFGMFSSFQENYDGEISQGHLIALQNDASMSEKSNVVFSQGAHPIPDETSLDGGEKLLEIAKGLGEDDTLVCLISGGGSSMFEVPKDEIVLESLRSIYQLLLESGADIHEVNSVRRALSKSKGGGLAKAAYPANIINIVISDVPGNNLEDIASGPTVPDPFKIRPQDVLKKYKMNENLDTHILDAIENYKPLNEKYFQNVRTHIIADNQKAQIAMCSKAHELDLHVTKFEGYLSGEARNTVKSFMETPGDLIIGGGETTVTVKGKGHGGRNQEFVLAGLKHVGNGVLASMGSDGIDGFTESAGALGDKDVLNTAEQMSYDIDVFLTNNDSYEFFRNCRGLIFTGPTGTNVADICVYFKNIS